MYNTNFNLMDLNKYLDDGRLNNDELNILSFNFYQTILKLYDLRLYSLNILQFIVDKPTQITSPRAYRFMLSIV